jgi:hypothetical protein
MSKNDPMKDLHAKIGNAAVKEQQLARRCQLLEGQRDQLYEVLGAMVAQIETVGGLFIQRVLEDELRDAREVMIEVVESS